MHHRKPNLVFQDDPPHYVLLAHLAAGKTVQQNTRTVYPGQPSWRNIEVNENVDEFPLYFRDHDTANRVAKAIVHAIALCGGGSQPELF